MKERKTTLTVKFFANLRRPAGTRQAEVTMSAGLSVGDFKKELVKVFPKLKNNMSVAMVSINHVYAEEDQIIPDAAVIALFPPVSGG